jgi:ribosomal-protein-alanine N-acetyltransferase
MENSIFKIVSNQGDNIHVCRIQPNDSWSICDFVVSNEQRLISFFPVTRSQNLTPDLSRIFTELKCKEFDLKQEYLFILKEAISKKVIGLIYIKELAKLEGQGEFAYAIDYNFEGKGIVSKAVSELTTYAFNDLNLDRLQIIVYKTNLGSVRVAENGGFIWKETLVKEFTPPGKEAIDMELYEYYKN